MTPGPRIQDFRTPADYYDLPADPFATDAISMKRRRVWCRDLLSNGQLHGAWERGVMSFMDGRWPWIMAAGMALIGFIALMFALG